MMIKQMGKNFTKLNQNTLTIMFKSLFKIIQDQKRAKMMNMSLQIFLHIYKLVGE